MTAPQTSDQSASIARQRHQARSSWLTRRTRGSGDGSGRAAPARGPRPAPDRLAADDAHRPRGPAPTVLPRGKSNTIGPGVRASLEKKPAGESRALRRRSFMKWSLPVGWVAFSAACTVEPGRHRALPVPQRALRAAAVVQGRLPRRVRRGRGRRALEGRVRRLDRARGRRLLRAQRDLHAPRLHAQLAGRREQVQVPLPRQRLLQHAASTSRARRRGRSSARASRSPTTARSSSTRRRKFQQEKGEWDNPESFLKA